MRHPLFDNILPSLSTPSPQLTTEEEAELLEPYTYLESSPGKNVCNQVIQALNHWLRVPPAQLQPIVHAIELLHNASLIIDDIEDESELRRGKPASHKIYGIPQTINAVNYVYFLAYQEVLKVPFSHQVELLYVAQSRSDSNISNPGLRLVQILNGESSFSDQASMSFLKEINQEEMLALHRGQGRELLWRNHNRCPTEEEYVEMVKDKTAGILRMAVRLMSVCATTNVDVDYVPLIELLGIWYQIRDDYMNLQSSAYASQKGFADDLAEGKYSFPVIHGIREKSEDSYLLDVLHQRPQSPTVKHQVIAYLDKVTHSFEYSRGIMSSMEAQARAEATRLGGNPMLEVILDKLAV